MARRPPRRHALPMAAPAKPARGRRLRRLAVALAGLALAATLASAAVHLRPASDARAPRFPIAALEVRGLRLLSGAEVLGASGVDVGSGLFDVDLDVVAARIAGLPWVRSARVERKPPDRLIVHLQERRRTAWIEWQGQLHGLDDEGVLLPPDPLEGEGIADLDLPVLRVPGFGTGDGPLPEVGHAVRDSTVDGLLGWWCAAVGARPQLAGEISQLEAMEAGAVRLRLVADDLEVRMPRDQVPERMATLQEILGRVYRECPNPAYVDLRFEGQAVIGMADAAAAAAAGRRPGSTVPPAGPKENEGHG